MEEKHSLFFTEKQKLDSIFDYEMNTPTGKLSRELNMKNLALESELV